MQLFAHQLLGTFTEVSKIGLHAFETFWKQWWKIAFASNFGNDSSCRLKGCDMGGSNYLSKTGKSDVIPRDHA